MKSEKKKKTKVHMCLLRMHAEHAKSRRCNCDLMGNESPKFIAGMARFVKEP